MQAGDLGRTLVGDAAHHRRTPVAALHPEAPVAQHQGHQLAQDRPHLLEVAAPLTGPEREAVAGQRRHHHREGVGRVAAEAGRIGQQGDDPGEPPERIRPAMTQQQRQRRRPVPLHVDEVHVEIAHLGHELRKLVDGLLLGPPVEPVPPVGHQLLQVPEVGAVLPGPRRARNLIRPPHPPSRAARSSRTSSPTAT